jgi:hypothetical protein
MSREKKSLVDDITKLRRILDNSSDPSLKYLISKDEYALESVRRRLSGDLFETQPYTDRFFRSSESLEPRVTIHTKTIVNPYLVTFPTQPEPSMPLPEFQFVSPSMPAPSVPSRDITFADEELFEVEKIDRSIPEFLEVTPKETVQETQKNDQTMHKEETSLYESNLPEWQPVEEEPTVESLETHETLTVEDVPEFEPVNNPPTPEEKPTEWGTLLTKEEQIEPPVDFIPAEPSEASFQTLSKKQERAAKKAQRKKDRDAKKFKKIELKQSKKEKQEDEQKQKYTAEEQQPFTQPPEEPFAEVKSVEITETHQIIVDYNNFKGIESIDDRTAELLYKNGYFSIENLKEATIDDLVQIHGIKRKLAKQMKKEIEEQITETDTSEFIPVKQKITKKKEKKKLEDSSEWESSSAKEKTQKSSSSRICTYKDYTLYKRETRKPDGKKSTIHYFTKSKPDKGHPSPLPEGYHIALNKKTGVPYVKKRR